MTALSASPAYQREYHRRRRAGISTRGLAREFRDGHLDNLEVPPRALANRISLLIARGAPTSVVMDVTGATYGQVHTVRRSME